MGNSEMEQAIRNAGYEIIYESSSISLYRGNEWFAKLIGTNKDNLLKQAYCFVKSVSMPYEAPKRPIPQARN